MGEGKGGGVEAAAIPVPSPHGRAQRSGEMGIIGRDGREFRPQGEEGFLPAEAAVEEPPLWLGAVAQGLG